MSINKGHICLLIFITVFLLFFFSPYGTGYQLFRMKLAKDHAKKVNKLLNKDARFTNIVTGAFTGGHGMFLVTGSVMLESDYIILQQLVASSCPPVEVKWAVIIHDNISGDMRNHGI